jgi:hypothetical protein
MSKYILKWNNINKQIVEVVITFQCFWSYLALSALVERLDCLYLQISKSGTGHLLSILLWLPRMQSQVQVLAGPPALVPSQRRGVVRMTKISLLRVFINLYFRVIFNIRVSPFLKRDHPLVNHAHTYQIIFNNGATNWPIFIAITSRTDVPFTSSGLCHECISWNLRTSAQEMWCIKLWRKGFQNSFCDLLHQNSSESTLPTSSPQLSHLDGWHGE